MPTETLQEDPRWAQADLEARAQMAVQVTLTHLGLAPDVFEVAVLGCDDTRIAALNAEFRGKPTATNVLSWPSWDLLSEQDGAAPEPAEPGTAQDPEPLGDIAIAYDTCLREAQAAGKPLVDHVTHLIVHGVLHLLGYDHIRDADATLMEQLEVVILGKMGIPDPYRIEEGATAPRIG